MPQRKTCRAEILWAFSPSGIKIPLDPKPEYRWIPIGTTADRFKLVKTWQTHFVTCPDAKEHRQQRATRRDNLHDSSSCEDRGKRAGS